MTAIEGLVLSPVEGARAEDARMETARPAVDLAVLVETYSAQLFRVAHSVLRSRAEAEDVVQDTFVRVLEHRRTLDQVRDMRVWLIRIAWNLALDRRRRIRPDQMDALFAESLVGGNVPADRAIDEAQRMQAVLAEMEKLPKAERHVLLLSASEELGTAEMAGGAGKERIGGAGTVVPGADTAAGAAGERK
jgi:RNA polymerase sigma-70 factor (ECF subfamily)